MAFNHDHNLPIKALSNLFQSVDVDLDSFEAEAIRSGSPFIMEQLIPALQRVANHFNEIENNVRGKRETEVLTKEFEFLQTVAALSPTFAQQMRQADLLEANVKDILRNSIKLNAMRQFLKFALDTANHKKLHDELEEALRAFYTKQHKAALEKANELKKHCARHHEPAQDEVKNLGSESINNARSNHMFDEVKVIGHFLSALFYMNYKAPVILNKLYPHMKAFSYKAVSEADDPKRKLSMQRYGGLVEPGAGPAAGGAPTPMRIPGVTSGA